MNIPTTSPAFTEGPWSQLEIDSGFIRSNNGKGVAQVNSGLEEYKANAHLIAAAPAMFALLTDYLKADKPLTRAACHKRAWEILDQINGVEGRFTEADQQEVARNFDETIDPPEDDYAA